MINKYLINGLVINESFLPGTSLDVRYETSTTPRAGQLVSTSILPGITSGLTVQGTVPRERFHANVAESNLIFTVSRVGSTSYQDSLAEEVVSNAVQVMNTAPSLPMTSNIHLGAVVMNPRQQAVASLDEEVQVYASQLMNAGEHINSRRSDMGVTAYVYYEGKPRWYLTDGCGVYPDGDVPVMLGDEVAPVDLTYNKDCTIFP